MYKATSIAYKDIQIFLKDRGTALQLFLLPLIFVAAVMMGSGETGDAEDVMASIHLPLVDLDGGESAQTLVDQLEKAGGVEIERYDQAGAEALLEEREIDHLLTIPEGFTAGISNGQEVTLRLTNHPGVDAKQTEALWLTINGAANDMSLESQILDSLEQMGAMQAGSSEASQAFAVERMQAQARSQFDLAQSRPLVAVDTREARQGGGDDEQMEMRDTSVPGIAVMFVFMAAQSAARSIYDEKKNGTFRRLLAAPMGKASFLAGKMLPTFITGLVQTAVIFGFGILGLRLFGMTPATLGKDPLATVLVIVLLCLASSAFGMLIAAIAKTEAQIGGLSTLLLWGLGILAIVPPFILERFLGFGRLVIPHYWASRALVDLMVRGGSLSNVTVEIAALAGFTALFFVIGLWQFDFDA